MLIVGKYFPEEISEWLRPSEVPNKKKCFTCERGFQQIL